MQLRSFRTRRNRQHLLRRQERILRRVLMAPAREAARRRDFERNRGFAAGVAAWLGYA